MTSQSSQATITSGKAGAREPPTASPRHLSRKTARAIWATIAGLIASTPLGWLLSFAASLPFMLGLFFFILFGLLIGAVMYRVGAAARPLPTRAVVVSTTVVVMHGWVLSLALEARDFPNDKAREALLKIAPLPPGTTAESISSDIRTFVDDTLATRYGGSGMIGYARWALASSEMNYHVETMKNPIVLRPAQHRWWWAARVILAAGLLAFGVHSQVDPLSRVRDERTAGIATVT